ncbi:PepSY-associated TM helix domain-containing protein [Flavobacterium sp. MC2016-06]|uniref:PepSY-associated TM helix domain-containing protein n=1 Tax=Flavobacterium sp. MC2016-06 TaxID=2676308 RepID=UPI0012BAA5F7|nr:PepSY-associated TM helix domain-containing protein [Flavobacterium sp. MC2016-06]MBU3859533.1 PepSY domain-containing protein [Flavobacterium sp. MC2016-06]
MGFTKQIRFLHKWLGLISGLIVFIVSITGCIFCFHDEIKDITRKEWRIVEPQNKPFLLPSVLQEKAKQIAPKNKITMVSYYGKNRSAIVYTYSEKENQYLYFNPYTGQYLKTENPAADFFIIVEYIHLYLLLPDYIGKHIIGVATIIFILLVISGLIQWWPKRKSDIKRSFTVKWSAKWRRVNYDWHNTSGFYISILAVVIAITGLTFTYEWVGDGIYKTFNFGGNKAVETKTPAIDTTKFDKNNLLAVDKAFIETMKHQPKAEMFFVMMPQKKGDIVSTGAYPHTLRFDHQSNYYFHPNDGKLIQSDPYDKKSLGLQVVEMNYGIHTGQILDLPGKIIAFIVSLIAAALPVTGFVIWYGRRKKSKVKK